MQSAKETQEWMSLPENMGKDFPSDLWGIFDKRDGVN